MIEMGTKFIKNTIRPNEPIVCKKKEKASESSFRYIGLYFKN